MITKPQKLNTENISQIFFLLAIIFVFFPIRYVFPTKEAFQTGAYSDFTSISLYLSDIFLFLSFIFILPRGITNLKGNKWLILAIIWLLISIIFDLSLENHYLGLNSYFFAKLIEFLIVAYGTTKTLFRDRDFRMIFTRLFVILGTAESILAIFQFIQQKSIGFNKLGEQVINPHILGIAKIIVNGREYIRSYGTFPHPNLLSAFLLTTIILNVFLLIRSKKNLARVLLSLCLIINTFGLLLTFSRASYLALGCSIILFVILFQVKKLLNNKVALSLATLGLALVLGIVVLKPFLLTRTTISDSASLERIFYAKIGLKIISAHPFTGVGLGQSVLDMQKYTTVKLWPWQIQPIHNYFLLAAAEIGIIGTVLLIILFLFHVKQLLIQIIKNRGEGTDFKIALIVIFSGYLILMQFDHYFYTIEQTQILLWVVLGIIAAEIQTIEG